jgi:hypothetical protein
LKYYNQNKTMAYNGPGVYINATPNGEGRRDSYYVEGIAEVGWSGQEYIVFHDGESPDARYGKRRVLSREDFNRVSNSMIGGQPLDRFTPLSEYESIKRGAASQGQ